MKKFNKNNYTWESVDVLKYKSDNSPFKDVTRQILFDGSFDIDCQWRYFEVNKGGYTTLESHEHTHLVMIYRGYGQGLVGDKVYDVSVGDIIVIPSRAMHQFRANKGSVLGFLCLVDQKRDKVKLPTSEKLIAMRKNSEIDKFLEDYESPNITYNVHVETKSKNGRSIEIETCDAINEFPITFGLTKRLGGVSKGNFESLNMGLHVGDEIQDVIKNREIVADILDMPFEKMVFAEQVHKDNVYKITKADMGKGCVSYNEAIAECDAMHTNEVGIPLAICVADCLPVLIYDPIKHAMATVHAGWRGVYNGIVQKTVLAMEAEYNSDRKNLLIYIGEGIGAESFEVSADLKEKFLIRFGQDVVLNNFEKNSFNIDLSLTLVQSLVRFGILTKNIYVSDLDTVNDKSSFSYRRDKGKTGRMALVAMLEKRD